MNLKNKVNIHNRFDIEVRDAKTGLLKKSFTSYNIVLNQMYTRLCGGLSYFVNIHFGSSTGTLSATRTSLFSHLGTKAAVDEEIVKAIPLSIWKRKIVLNPEEFVGSTISEVGIAYGATNTNLVTHSLLKDSEGNPISIIKTDVDVITIYATVFVTFDNSNPNLVYIGMPSSNALVNYLIGGGSSPLGAFSLNDVFLVPTKLGTTSNVTWTSDPVNKQRKTNVPRFSTTVGNGHVKFLEFINLFCLELPYISIFNGQSYLAVPLGVGDGIKKEFKLPSANIKQSSIILKNNGIVDSNRTIRSFRGGFRSQLGNPSSPPGMPSKAAALNGGKEFLIAVNNSLGIYKEVNGLLVWQGYLPSFPSGTITSIESSFDGNSLAITFSNSPFLITYKRINDSWIKIDSPISFPASACSSASLSSDGLVLAVCQSSGSTIYSYDFIDGSWVVRTNPSSISISNLNTISLSSDGTKMAVGGVTSPYLIIYKFIDNNWILDSIPSALPSSEVKFVSLSESGNLVGIALSNSSFYIYDLENSGIVRQNPSSFPSGTLQSFTMSKDGNTIFVGNNSSPYAHIYHWVGTSWLKDNNIVDIPPYTTIASSISNDLQSMILVFSGQTPWVKAYKSLSFSSVIFETTPAVSDVITADYTVEGIHKTDQYVIDVSFAIQFGEGS